jgi:hypothetical protein
LFVSAQFASADVKELLLNLGFIIITDNVHFDGAERRLERWGVHRHFAFVAT